MVLQEVGLKFSVCLIEWMCFVYKNLNLSQINSGILRSLGGG